jgi:hypothetical protein
MSQLLAAPMWIVITLFVFIGYILVGPNRPYSRALELLRAWRNLPEETSHDQPTNLDPDDSSIPAVAPRPLEPRASIAVLLAAAVIAVGLPATWRRRYRSDFASELSELKAYQRAGYVVRALVRLPILRIILVEAVREARKARV